MRLTTTILTAIALLTIALASTGPASAGLIDNKCEYTITEVGYVQVCDLENGASCDTYRFGLTLVEAHTTPGMPVSADARVTAYDNCRGETYGHGYTAHVGAGVAAAGRADVWAHWITGDDGEGQTCETAASARATEYLAGNSVRSTVIRGELLAGTLRGVAECTAEEPPRLGAGDLI